MGPTLLIAAHGTVSDAGSATTHALAEAVATARPEVAVALCFLDVARPTLTDALDALSGEVVVVPLLLSAGYHVTTDIPAIVEGRAGVRVSRHLGPDPLVVDAVTSRLESAARGTSAASTALAAVSSSRSSAHAEVDAARSALAQRLGRAVSLLPLGSSARAAVDALPQPVEVAVYLLAEGTFLDDLREFVAGRGVVADPIGVHPSLVQLVLARYDEVAGG